MRRPRFSILGLMALVTLVALDCGAWDLMVRVEDAQSGWRQVAFLILLGEMAMANALAIAAWLAWRRRGPGSIAFLAVGTALMLTFVSATFVAPDVLMTWIYVFALWAYGPLHRAFPNFFESGGLIASVVVYSLILALLAIPQLVPSLLAAAFFGSGSSAAGKAARR